MCVFFFLCLHFSLDGQCRYYDGLFLVYYNVNILHTGYALLKFLMLSGFKCVMQLLLLGGYPNLYILSEYASDIFLTCISISRGPSTLATFVAVYALFGPTFPGIYDKDRGVYFLFYPVCTLET